MNRRLERAFPNLAASGYAVTSSASDDYNCIAWAMDDTERWWWPDPAEREYWPTDVPREETLAAFVTAFETLGFGTCESDELEPGFEKVALFTDQQGVPTHAARQLPSGDWTSKLGAWEDISHVSLDSLAGEYYGAAVILLKRLRP